MNRHERRKQKATQKLVALQKVSYLGTTRYPKMEIPQDRLGPAGVPSEIHILAKEPNERINDTARLQDTSLRTFKVVATLAKAPPTNEHINGTFCPDDGASYIMALPGINRIKVDTSEGCFYGTTNQAGEISLIEFECLAESVFAARCLFQRTVFPTLDHWSYVNNCPIIIDRISFTDQKNSRQTVDYIGPYKKQPISHTKVVLYDSLKPIYSLYREAQNSQSNFYKFLCYYKVLEGLLTTLKANHVRTVKAAGLNVDFPRQCVPNHPDLDIDWLPYVGKPLKRFFDDVLTPEFRNAVAHFSTTEQAILDMSNPVHIAKYARTIYVTELCARSAIADHEYALSKLL